MRQYRFVTTWVLDAPIEDVFEAIRHSEAWPLWWRGVTHVEEIAPGDADGVGNLRRYTFCSLLPYALTFDMRTTRIEVPRRLDGEASGELVGVGRWELTPSNAGVVVRYEWEVGTSRAWMNLLSPLAGPVFAWNHNIIMRWGEEGLRARLGLPPREDTGDSARRGRVRLLAMLGIAAVLAALRLRWGR